MSKSLHIVLDNNSPKRLVEDLATFWRVNFPDWIIEHENDIARGETKDSHWIGRLSEIDDKRDWLIITKDRGANDSKDSEKLPLLCKHFGHAYLILSDGLGRRMDQFKSAISAVWLDFPKVVEACHKLKWRKKAHVKLAQVTSKNHRIGFRLQVYGGSLHEFLESPPSEPVIAPFGERAAPAKPKSDEKPGDFRLAAE